MKSLDRQKLAIGGFVLAGLLVAVAGYLLAVKPQGSKVQSLDAQIAQAQNQYTALHAVRSSKHDSLNAAELFQLSRAMPNVDDQPGILLELSRLARSTSLKLVSVSIQPRVALLDGSSAVPMTVTVVGSWPNLARFLRQVRAQVEAHGTTLSIGGRLFTVDQIAVTPAPTLKGAVQAQLQMNAFDYGAPPSPSATAGVTGNTTTTDTTTTTTTSSTSGSQQAAGTSGSSS